MKTMRLAFKKMSIGVLLLQWFGNLAAMLLAFLWLQIPDSHAWEFAFSVLAAGLLAFLFLWLQAYTFRVLHPQSGIAPLWRRLLILLAMIGAGFLLNQAIDAGRAHEGLLAGYWNSRFSPGVRTLYTYQRLVQWQECAYNLLQWLLAALLLPIALLTAGGGWRHAGRVYRRIIYWFTAVAAGLVGGLIGGALVSWTPGHGTVMEIISMLLRLGLTYTVGVILWCFVLAVMAVSAEETVPAS
jgi:hypothetical protein